MGGTPDICRKIKPVRFTMSNGIIVVALDTSDVDKLFSKDKFHALTRAFVEVELPYPSSLAT
jgi:hypothetical protein